MIVQISGNVTYPITLDPSVWIFDDRKILFEDAFKQSTTEEKSSNVNKENYLGRTYDETINPPVNKNITKGERDEILKNTYVMPIHEFLNYAEIKPKAKEAKLITSEGEKTLPIEVLKDCYLLFAVKGKQLKDNGPVHVYFKDGSNKDHPIKGVKEIIIL